VTGAAATSLDEMVLPAGRVVSAASICAKSVKNGVTVAGGTWGVAVQQLAFGESQGMPIWEQQLCVARPEGSTHVPTDSSSTPIREIPIAARWLIPRNIVSAYHVQEILQ
jgi:hypothetical protein